MPARLALLAIFVTVAACGGSNKPTPQPANLSTTGTLSVQNCQGFSQTGLFQCGLFTGLMQNTGTGCAGNIRGTTVTVLTASGQQIGSAGWSHGVVVRPNEQFSYEGGPLVVAQTGSWAYTTTASWDNVACQ